MIQDGLGASQDITYGIHNCSNNGYVLKPEVLGSVGPDPQAELQVDTARGPQDQIHHFVLHHLNI